MPHQQEQHNKSNLPKTFEAAKSPIFTFKQQSTINNNTFKKYNNFTAMYSPRILAIQ